MVDDPGPQGLEALGLDGLIEAAPPDPLVGPRLVDDELVLGRAAGVLAGRDGETAALRDEALVPLDGGLDEAGRREVGVDRGADVGDGLGATLRGGLVARMRLVLRSVDGRCGHAGALLARSGPVWPKGATRDGARPAARDWSPEHGGGPASRLPQSLLA